jgi:hypothetical protein
MVIPENDLGIPAPLSQYLLWQKLADSSEFGMHLLLDERVSGYRG